MSGIRPTFLDAYLVAEDSMGAPAVGVVRRERHVWRIMLFGVPPAQQPPEAFATREQAGTRLLALAQPEPTGLDLS